MNHQRQSDAHTYQQKRRLIFASITYTVVVLLILFLVYSARWIILVSALAVGLGVLLSPVVELSKRKLKFPGWLSGLVLAALIFSFLFGVGFLINFLVQDQFIPFFERAPQLWSRAQARILEGLSDYPTLQNSFSRLRIDNLVIQATGRMFEGIRLGTTAIAGFIFVVFVAVFTSLQSSFYLKSMLYFVHPRKKPRVRRLATELASTLRSWASAQLIAMVIVGVGTSIGLWIVGVDSWPLLGLLTGVLDIVPYIGPLVAGSLSVLLAFAEEPSKAIWVLGIFVLVQQLEAHLVIPYVMSQRVQLPSVYLMIVMLLFAHWFGVLGMLIAPAVLAIARTAVFELYPEKQSSAEMDSAMGKR